MIDPSSAVAVSPEPLKAPARKAYSAPALKSLGSVKDLTFGAAGSVGEAIGRMAM